jgi:hypothetical protein
MFDRFFSRRSKASLDSLQFDTSRYHYFGEENGQRTWGTPDGVSIGLHFFDLPPNLPKHTRTSAELQEFYQKQIGNNGVAIVEFRIRPMADVPCIWMILRIPRESHGMIYIGSITVPFAEFSFVIKGQCEEQGITGIRETALLLTAQKEGKITLGENGIVGEWNPDDECYDEQFPQHPVSLLRAEFRDIASTLKIQEAIKRERRFALPPETA